MDFTSRKTVRQERGAREWGATWEARSEKGSQKVLLWQCLGTWKGQAGEEAADFAKGGLKCQAEESEIYSETKDFPWGTSS